MANATFQHKESLTPEAFEKVAEEIRAALT
jgi:hypothetical protein